MNWPLRLNVSQHEREPKSLSYDGRPSRAFQTLAFLLATSCISWAVGRALGNPKAARDTVFLVALTVFFCRHALPEAPQNIVATVSEAWIFVVPLLALNGLQLVYLHRSTSEGLTATEQSTASPLKPLIFPASTSHTRLFPRHHSFKYSYLLVGVPVGAPGNAGNVLCWDTLGRPHWWRNAWFSVHAEDYLLYTRPSIFNTSEMSSKAADPPTLREKLEAYLKSQGIDPSTYPHAYLVTAPRVLGFSFNPVSFWYLYDDSMVLKAMILEVNNTFGERRMYFMQDTDDDEDVIEDGSREAVKEGKGTKRFRSKWNKDFHVSPFNDREGVYSLTAIDPFASSKSPLAPGEEGAVINNIITLSSPIYHTPHPPTPANLPSPPSTSTSCDPSSLSAPSNLDNPTLHPKIIASISSSSTPLNPSTLSLTKKYIFLLRWAWLGFLTNPRILAEARQLWSKGLKVWFRPEVRSTTVGRVETREEGIVEGYVRVWLESMCRGIARDGQAADGTVSGATNRRIRVWYTPAAGADRGHAIPITDDACETELDAPDAETAEINITVLTPAFYTELIVSQSLRGVWERCCLNPIDGEAMVTCSDPDRLRKLIEQVIDITETPGKHEAFKKDKGKKEITKTFMPRLNDNLRSGRNLITGFISAVLEPIQLYVRGRESTKIRPPSDAISFADAVRPCIPQHEFHDFEHPALLILLAQRYSLSSTSLLRFYGSILRYALIYVVASETSCILQELRGANSPDAQGGGMEMGFAQGPVQIPVLVSKLARTVVMSVVVSSVGRFFRWEFETS